MLRLLPAPGVKESKWTPSWSVSSSLCNKVRKCDGHEYDTHSRCWSETEVQRMSRRGLLELRWPGSLPCFPEVKQAHRRARARGSEVRPARRWCAVCHLPECNSGLSLHKETMRSAAFENEAVVCAERCGWGWGWWWWWSRGPVEAGWTRALLEGGCGITWRYFLCWLLTGSLGCLVTNLTWAKMCPFLQRNVITWQFTASEKRSLLGIVEKASAAHQLASRAIISQQSGRKWSLFGRCLLTEETLSSPVLSLFTSLKVKQLSASASPGLKDSLCSSSNRNHNL